MKVIGFLSLRQRSRSFKEAYPPSATVTISRSGCQRLTCKSNCQAHSASFLCRFPRSLLCSVQKEPAPKERAVPKSERPWDRSQQHQANPPQSARFDEVVVTGAHRIAVDSLCHDHLPLTALQSLVYTNHQRSSSGHECLHEQPEQDATGLLARPDGTVEHSMVAAEPPFLLEARCSEGGGYIPLAQSEYGSRQQYLDVLEEAFGEQWRERSQKPYHHGR